MEDEILTELRRIREEHAAEFDYDMDRIFEDWKRRESESVPVHYTVTDNLGRTADGDETINVAPIVADSVVWTCLSGQATNVPGLIPSTHDIAGSPNYNFSGLTITDGAGLLSNENSATGAFTFIPPSTTTSETVHVHYSVMDQFHNSANGDITINVSPIITDPFGLNALESQPAKVPSLLGSVQDVSSTSVYTFSDLTVQGGQGTVTGVDTTTGAFTYTPPSPTFVGVVKVAYTVTDASHNSATGTVAINVEPGIVAQNQGPFSVVLGQSVTIPVSQLLNNDAAPNGAKLMLESVQGAQNGLAVLNADGTITFTPKATGSTSFTYTVGDSAGDRSATATVMLTVLSQPNPPPAQPTPPANPNPPPGLTIRLKPPTGRVKHKVGGTIAHLETILPKINPSAYHAVVNWGDGTVQGAKISKAGAHGFNVKASHKYAEAGSYVASLTISDSMGDRVTEPFVVNVH